MGKYIAIIDFKDAPRSKVPNLQLKKAFEYLGFHKVKVVSSPKAVIFEYWMNSRSSLGFHIHRIIKEKFGVDTEISVTTYRPMDNNKSN